MNKSPIILILMLSLILSMGCAKSDWIQNTLVTVDVTGAWDSKDIQMTLKQEGAAVRGTMFLTSATLYRPGGGFGGSQSGTESGQIAGTVAGDMFRFKQTSQTTSGWSGELTVSGDEMSGELHSPLGIRQRIVLRRLDSSPPPRSQ